MMTEMLVESVLIAFCVGGAVGSIITMHFTLGKSKRSEELQVAHRRIQK